MSGRRAKAEATTKINKTPQSSAADAIDVDALDTDYDSDFDDSPPRKQQKNSKNSRKTTASSKDKSTRSDKAQASSRSRHTTLRASVFADPIYTKGAAGKIWKSDDGHPVGSAHWLKEIFSRDEIWEKLASQTCVKKRLTAQILTKLNSPATNNVSNPKSLKRSRKAPSTVFQEEDPDDEFEDITANIGPSALQAYMHEKLPRGSDDDMEVDHPANSRSFDSTQKSSVGSKFTPARLNDCAGIDAIREEMSEEDDEDDEEPGKPASKGKETRQLFRKTAEEPITAENQRDEAKLAGEAIGKRAKQSTYGSALSASPKAKEAEKDKTASNVIKANVPSRKVLNKQCGARDGTGNTEKITKTIEKVQDVRPSSFKQDSTRASSRDTGGNDQRETTGKVKVVLSDGEPRQTSVKPKQVDFETAENDAANEKARVSISSHAVKDVSPIDNDKLRAGAAHEKKTSQIRKSFEVAQQSAGQGTTHEVSQAGRDATRSSTIEGDETDIDETADSHNYGHSSGSGVVNEQAPVYLVVEEGDNNEDAVMANHTQGEDQRTIEASGEQQHERSPINHFATQSEVAKVHRESFLEANIGDSDDGVMSNMGIDENDHANIDIDMDEKNTEAVADHSGGQSDFEAQAGMETDVRDEAAEPSTKVAEAETGNDDNAGNAVGSDRSTQKVTTHHAEAQESGGFEGIPEVKTDNQGKETSETKKAPSPKATDHPELSQILHSFGKDHSANYGQF